MPSALRLTAWRAALPRAAPVRSALPLRDGLAMAFASLVSHSLRSALTILGILIGNASVITLLGVGRGTQTLASSQRNVLGANVLFVAPGSHNTRHQGVAPPRTLTPHPRWPAALASAAPICRPPPACC